MFCLQATSGGGGGEKREHLYKVLVIGELGTGKTSIIKRYVHQFFSQHYRATVSFTTSCGFGISHLLAMLLLNIGWSVDSVSGFWLERSKCSSLNHIFQIGVDFALKVINWDADTLIRLQLWDIAGKKLESFTHCDSYLRHWLLCTYGLPGQERFGNMTRVYYKEAVGCFIVFDVTRVSTFEAVQKWKNDLDSKVQLADGSPIPCILLGNKVGLLSCVFQLEWFPEWADNKNCMQGYHLTLWAW